MLAPLARGRSLVLATLCALTAVALPARVPGARRLPTPVAMLRVDDSTRCDLARAATDALARELGNRPALRLLPAEPASAEGADDAATTPPAPPRRSARRRPTRPLAQDAGQGLMLQVTACQDRLGAGPGGRPRRLAFARVAVSIMVSQLPRQQLLMTTGAEAEVGVEVGPSGRLSDQELRALRRDALEQALQRAVSSYAETLTPAARQPRRRSRGARPASARRPPSPRRPRP